jgi:hypothetical protein
VRLALGIAAAVLVTLGGVARAQPQHMDLSQFPTSKADAPPEIILLTFGEGVQIFEKFGHAALCVRYPGVEAPKRYLQLLYAQNYSPETPELMAQVATQVGLSQEMMAAVPCVNYGVTDFREGAAMVWHFLRTEQKFWADTESMLSMIAFYSGHDALGHQLEEDRDIYVQRLPLSPDQARAIEGGLRGSLEDANHRPCRDHKAEGCYYYYDHFFNNCTTRLRDMIDDATAGKLAGDSKSTDYPLTFRQMGRRGLAELPPLITLADFVLGRQLDDTPTLWQAMFHPDVLRDQVRTQLHVEPVHVYTRTGPPFPQDGSTGRAAMLAIGLVFGLPLLLARWRRPGGGVEKAALIWATFYLVMWGLIVWGLVAISSIPGVRWNEAVLVVMPLDLCLPALGPMRRLRYARARVLGLVAVSLLCAVGVFHQPLWIPIVCVFLPMVALATPRPTAA